MKRRTRAKEELPADGINGTLQGAGGCAPQQVYVPQAGGCVSMEGHLPGADAGDLAVFDPETGEELGKLRDFRPGTEAPEEVADIAEEGP